MLHEVPFDNVASTYDVDFTNSIIGKLQRERVRILFDKNTGGNCSLDILEINCGTGEDAIWLSKKGHHVTATDISQRMIDVAISKVEELHLNIQFERCSFAELNKKFEGKQFDIIFSNFAGLNCINETELKKLNSDFSLLLKHGGKLIMVLLGKYCWIERMYFMLKRDFKKSKRRAVTSEANLGNGSTQTTWCYSVREVQHYFSAFKLIGHKPVGIIIPPSYIEPLLKRIKFIIPLMQHLERIFSKFSSLSNYGDHVFIVMSKE